jgi:hypothetical protein
MNTPQVAAEHEFEAEYGLPEKLPADEHILWQGSPQWIALAHDVFHVNKIIIYFIAIVLLRMWFVFSDSDSLLLALQAASLLTPLFAITVVMIYALAYYTAKTCVYTITNKRVVMRVGIVLSVTYNLPYRQIIAANLLARGKNIGDIALQLDQSTRIAYLQLWPHVRSWQVRRPQPNLRSVAQVKEVAYTMTEAWKTYCQSSLSNIHQLPARAIQSSTRGLYGKTTDILNTPLTTSAE